MRSACGWAKSAVMFRSHRAWCQLRSSCSQETREEGRPFWTVAHQEGQSCGSAPRAGTPAPAVRTLAVVGPLADECKLD